MMREKLNRLTVRELRQMIKDLELPIEKSYRFRKVELIDAILKVSGIVEMKTYKVEFDDENFVIIKAENDTDAMLIADNLADERDVKVFDITRVDENYEEIDEESTENIVEMLVENEEIVADETVVEEVKGYKIFKIKNRYEIGHKTDEKWRVQAYDLEDAYIKINGAEWAEIENKVENIIGKDNIDMELGYRLRNAFQFNDKKDALYLLELLKECAPHAVEKIAKMLEKFHSYKIETIEETATVEEITAMIENNEVELVVTRKTENGQDVFVVKQNNTNLAYCYKLGEIWKICFALVVKKRRSSKKFLQ